MQGRRRVKEKIQLAADPGDRTALSAPRGREMRLREGLELHGGPGRQFWNMHPRKNHFWACPAALTEVQRVRPGLALHFSAAEFGP